jgi:hypothetical protein
MTRVYRGMRIGAVVAAVASVLWTLALLFTPPEPPAFLDVIRGRSTQRAVDPSSGISFDLHSCSHCPAFVIFERGFGSGVEPLPLIPLTLWSLPALWLARTGASGGWEIELNPLHFAAALFLQSMVVGIAVGLARPRSGTG